MNLIIVESPTKAKTLSRFLGQEFAVEATMGHIKDLPKSQLGVDVKNNFKPDYLVLPKQEETVKNLKAKAKKAKQVFLATDPDREGEAIAQHAREILNGKDTKMLRIVFHEITPEAVTEAIAHPRKIDKNLVDAQIARRVLDRLVGYKLSPLLWRKVRLGLSAGRVQSVVVRLIVEKEREIAKFKAEEFWEIFAKVKSKKEKSEFTVQLIKVEVKDKKTAAKILSDLKKAKYKVLDIKKRQVRKNPYPPFTTSTMTQAGARLFGWSAKRTMMVAQKLYERGRITYHRTDSTNIAKSALEKTIKYIGVEFGKDYLPETPRFYKTTSKVAQEAHEAIRPTDPTKSVKEFSKLKPDEKRLYDLIWRRFIACQMAASVSDETTIDVEAGKYLLRASGQIMKFAGWRKVIPVGKLEGEQELPELAVGEPLQLIKVDGQQKFTQPPARFNEASLIKTLEKLGIGRPSTYAPIISTIQTRLYVEKTEGKFFPTPVGVAVNDFLMKNFPEVLDYQFTAEMEDDLDKVADGKRQWTTDLKTFYQPFAKKLKTVTEKSKRVKIAVEKLGKKCPKCKTGELVIRVGRFGKFISCSRFPDCDYTEKFLEKIGMKCPKCKKGEVIVKKSGKWRKFFGCSRYPDCNWASWKNPKVKNERDKNS
jgi:DNA topoisomerase-1